MSPKRKFFPTLNNRAQNVHKLASVHIHTHSHRHSLTNSLTDWPTHIQSHILLVSFLMWCKIVAIYMMLSLASSLATVVRQWISGAVIKSQFWVLAFLFNLQNSTIQPLESVSCHIWDTNIFPYLATYVFVM